MALAGVVIVGVSNDILAERRSQSPSVALALVPFLLKSGLDSERLR